MAVTRLPVCHDEAVHMPTVVTLTSKKKEKEKATECD
jgi:hypothetical protein